MIQKCLERIVGQQEYYLDWKPAKTVGWYLRYCHGKNRVRKNRLRRYHLRGRSPHYLSTQKAGVSPELAAVADKNTLIDLEPQLVGPGHHHQTIAPHLLRLRATRGRYANESLVLVAGRRLVGGNHGLEHFFGRNRGDLRRLWHAGATTQQRFHVEFVIRARPRTGRCI